MRKLVSLNGRHCFPLTGKLATYVEGWLFTTEGRVRSQVEELAQSRCQRMFV
ncbi:MAG: hypothetical protein ACTS6A_00890 [Candidatus Hodgkinia cicadicola]